MVVGAIVVGAAAAFEVIVATVVDTGLPLTVVVGATDWVVSTAGCIVVETTSKVVEVASLVESDVVGAADCATTVEGLVGSESLDEAPSQAPSSMTAAGTSRSNARLTTGLWRVDARLVP